MIRSIKFFFTASAFVFFMLPLQAQDLLPVDTSHRCILTYKYFFEPLYSFSPDPEVEVMVAKILDAADKSRNFSMVNSNVHTVAALAYGNTKILLYNSEFFNEQRENQALRFAVLAHEIDHLIQQHTLAPEKRLQEEYEADKFVGEVMRDLGFSLEETLVFTDLPGYSYDLKPEERSEFVRIAWEKRNSQILAGEKAGFWEDNGNLENLPIPKFPWPPPPCARREQLNRTNFSGCVTLENVNNRLVTLLGKCGYWQRSYFYVPGGFALVTPFEQYNQDGSKMSDTDRWKDYPVVPNTDWVDRFKRFFTGYTGYFRIIVFIVTDKSFNLNTQSSINSKDAKAWGMAGFDSLPPEIGGNKFSTNHKVTAMVYEFQANSSTNDAKDVCPASLYPQKHFSKSGFQIRK